MTVVEGVVDVELPASGLQNGFLHEQDALAQVKARKVKSLYVELVSFPDISHDYVSTVIPKDALSAVDRRADAPIWAAQRKIRDRALQMRDRLLPYPHHTSLSRPPAELERQRLVLAGIHGRPGAPSGKDV